MAKREREDEVAGYLHAVSPIKISKSNNSYFVGKLQTDTNVFKKMVCFDQSKHSSFHEATAAKTPIKICNVRKVQSREDSAKVDVLVNAKSQMHVVRSLTFQHHADDNVDDENKSLADILHIPEKNKVIAFYLLPYCTSPQHLLEYHTCAYSQYLFKKKYYLWITYTLSHCQNPYLILTKHLLKKSARMHFFCHWQTVFLFSFLCCTLY